MFVILKTRRIIKPKWPFLFLLTLFLPSLLFAADLTVVDSLGLVRAIKNVSSSGRVIVVIPSVDKNGGPKSLVLSNTDGMAPDIAGTWNSKNEYTFEGVAPGTWEIRAKEQNVHIKSVKILQ